MKAKQDCATNQQLDQLKAQISTLQSERQKEKGLAEEEAKKRRIQTELAEIEAKEKIEKLAKGEERFLTSVGLDSYVLIERSCIFHSRVSMDTCCLLN